MIVADYILQRLVTQGVTHAFGIYGAANAYLFDAFSRQSAITMIPTAHEQGAGLAAEGYSKARIGALGVAIATSGPGALNLATPIANCFYDSVPVLFICGQVSTKVMRRDGSKLRQRGFQECPVADVFKPITKLSVEVRRAEDVRDAIDAAFDVALKGRPGPVVLSLPLDVLAAPVPPWGSTRPAHHFPPVDVLSVDLGTQALCLDALRKAKRPVIIAGGGVLSCAAEVRAFAERFGVPVFPTWNAIEVAPDDWPLFGGRIGTYGGKGRNFAIQQADYVLALGCRFSGRLFGGRPESFLRGAHGNIWHVDADRTVLAELEQDLSALKRVRMHSDVAEWLRAAEVTNNSYSFELDTARMEWRADVRQWRDTYDPVKLHEVTKISSGVNPYLFIRELSRLAPENAVAINDCGGNTVIFQQAWEAKRGQRIFSSHGNSPMGGAIGYGIGAAIAEPERPVIVVIGDGGFTLGAAELNTIRVQQERLRNLRIFVLNNGILGITRAWQRMNLDGRVSACGPDAESGYEAPNVVSVCRAYGVAARRLELVEAELDGAPYPRVIDVQCPGWDIYEPRVTGWDRPIEEMLPSLPADEFVAQMKYVPPVGGWRERR